MIAPYIFVIDTDSYAGNFERELCACCTGIWDYETHGGKEAKLFYQETGYSEEQNPFEAYVGLYSIEHDGNYWAAPQCLILTPQSKQNNSVGIFMSQEPHSAIIHNLKARAIKYSKSRQNCVGTPDPFKVIGFRLIRQQLVSKEIILSLTQP